MLPGTNKEKSNGNGVTSLWSCEFNAIFEEVFEHSLIGMAILDPKGAFLRLNKKACEIWEYSEKELIGKTWKDITYPEDMSKSTHYVESYNGKSDKFNLVLEKRYVTGCGHIKTCKITTSAIRNEDNEVVYFIIQVEDITQKKEAIAFITDFLKKCKS